MKIDMLDKYFDAAESDQIAFSGKCHDCKEDVTINLDRMDKEILI